jgi:hypothetical protein
LNSRDVFEKSLRFTSPVVVEFEWERHTLIFAVLRARLNEEPVLYSGKRNLETLSFHNFLRKPL